MYQLAKSLRFRPDPSRLLKYGRVNLIKINAKISEINERIKDSERNCVISIPLVEPPIFFIPTSFALLDACAVERFIKLIAAIKTISIAILPNIIRYFGSLAALNSC